MPAPQRQTREPDDRVLAAKAVDGDRDAFAVLVERWHEPLYNFIYRRCGDTHRAADLTQETFLRAWRSIGRYDPRWAFSTWLFTLGRRIQIDERRRDGRRPAHDGLAEPIVDAGDDDAASPGAIDIWTVAQRVLTPDQHLALWLRYAFDLEIADLARILGRSAISTRVVLFRARQRVAASCAADDRVDAATRHRVPTSRPAAPSGTMQLTEVAR